MTISFEQLPDSISLLKVNNLSKVPLLLTLNIYFKPSSSVSVISFEHVIADWAILKSLLTKSKIKAA